MSAAARCPWCGSDALVYIESFDRCTEVVGVSDGVLYMNTDREGEDGRGDDYLECVSCSTRFPLPDHIHSYVFLDSIELETIFGDADGE